MGKNKNNIEKIEYLSNNYSIPIYVLSDVRLRLIDFCSSVEDEVAIEMYAGQQLRYIENVLKKYGYTEDLYKNLV